MNQIAYQYYVRRIGAPRVTACQIDLGNRSWRCVSHDYDYVEREHMLDGWLDDRCPVARLEEWRGRRWEATA